MMETGLVDESFYPGPVYSEPGLDFPPDPKFGSMCRVEVVDPWQIHLYVYNTEGWILIARIDPHTGKYLWTKTDWD